MTTGVNVLHTLGKGIVKNGVREARSVIDAKLINQFAFGPVLHVPKKRVMVTDLGTAKNEYLRQKLSLVGKGSNFEKQVVQEYLSPLRTHPFARHHILNNYDETRANLSHRTLKSIQASQNSKGILFNRSHQFVGELISLLISLTPHDMQVDLPMRIFPEEVFTEVPPVPDFQKNPHLFEDYIALLCHSTFFHRKSSKLNGIIPKMLRNFMHPSNMNTVHLRSVNVFNDVMFFFSQRSDYATCRELLAQMKIELVSPNTKTFNIMLRNVLKNSHIRKTKSSFDEAIYFLKQMKHSDVRADTVTWTTCYNLLLEDMSRDVFIEKMIQSNVQASPSFVFTVLKNGDFSSTQILKFLAENSVPLTSKLFNLCIKKLVSEEKYEISWAFMNHAYENANCKVNKECLNIFLRFFAEAGRLDLALVTFNTAVTKYEICPNVESFEMLFKALVRNGYTSNFSVIFEYLKMRMKKHTRNTSINSYWLVKARAISKFNIKRNVTENQILKAEEILQTALWDSQGLQWKCWKNCGASMRRVLRYIGCLPKHVKPTNKTVQFDTSPATVIRKASYKKRIRFLAVQNAMLARIPYAKNRFSALKSELSERKIVN